MRRPIAPFGVLALLAFAPAATSADEPAEVPEFARRRPDVESGEPILRFNGEDLTGFYPYTKDHGYDDPNRVFTVKDGTIHVSGEEWGGLATCGNFRDYHLIAEWKWGEATHGQRAGKARDSGILLHCVGADGAAGGQWMQSVECQIIEGGCGDFILVAGREKVRMTCAVRPGEKKQLYFDPSGESITREGGRYNWWGRDPAWMDVVDFRGPRDVEAPTGDWNRMEVICDGDTITNIVNGLVVNVGTGSSLAEGKIQFQSEGAEIVFRRIEVRPLKKSPKKSS